MPRSKKPGSQHRSLYEIGDIADGLNGSPKFWNRIGSLNSFMFKMEYNETAKTKTSGDSLVRVFLKDGRYHVREHDHLATGDRGGVFWESYDTAKEARCVARKITKGEYPISNELSNNDASNDLDNELESFMLEGVMLEGVVA